MSIPPIQPTRAEAFELGQAVEQSSLDDGELPGAGVDPDVPAGIGPYKLALRRLRRNRVALAFGGLFLLIVVLCLLAPVYSADIAHIGPNDQSNITAILHY